MPYIFHVWGRTWPFDWLDQNKQWLFRQQTVVHGKLFPQKWLVHMLQVENEFEDTERDWFEIQSDQHSKLRRIVVKLLWMIQFDLKMVDPRNYDLSSYRWDDSDWYKSVVRYLSFADKYHKWLHYQPWKHNQSAPRSYESSKLSCTAQQQLWPLEAQDRLFNIFK